MHWIALAFHRKSQYRACQLIYMMGRWKALIPATAWRERVDRLACPEVHRGRFPAVLLDLELDLLTFIERA